MEEIKEESSKAHAFEVIDPAEFIRRLGIARSTLHLWKSKGWLVERRHFLKIGKTVLYYWSNELLLELHDNSNRNSSLDKEPVKPRQMRTTLGNERVNWDY
jgi:hypothetical protein